MRRNFIKTARQGFLLLFLCVVFAACSSDDTVALNQWFEDRGIANSYGLQQEDIYLSVDTSFTNVDTSAFLVSSSAALGKANGIEQLLYFGLEVSGSLSPVWKLRTDSVFYSDFYSGNVPEEHKNIKARFYWLKENKIEHDTTWLKFQNKFKDSADIDIEWIAGGTRDTFSILLPTEFSELKADTLRLLVSIRLLADDAVLRIAPPNILDIPGLLRVAQKTSVSECKLCLHSGIGEFFSVIFSLEEKDKKRIAGKPVVFAELIMPKLNDATNEFGFPMPVYVNSESYRVDTAYVNRHGNHPNLVFWEGDSLRLQVTQSLRSYANEANSQESLEFTLRFGTPMLKPSSHNFFNSSSNKVFSDRFAFANYNFGSALAEPVKLRLWFADFGDKK